MPTFLSPMPAFLSPMPTFLSPMPAFLSPMPAFLSPMPAFLSPMPAFLSPMPTFLSPMPTFLSPMPTFLSPMPTFLSPMPTFLSPMPAFLSPMPTFLSPMPTFLSPMPTFLSPMPTFLSPMPTFLSPMPTFLSPMPTFLSPMPTFLSLIPTFLSPMPAFLSPMPTFLSPMPTFLSPMPTFLSLMPTFLSPMPTFLSLMPTFLSPMPTFLSPMPAFLSPMPTFLSPMPAFLSPMPTFLSPMPTFLSPMPAFLFHHVVLLQPSGWKSQADPMCKDVYGVGEVGIGRRTAAGGPGYALTAVSDDKVTTLSIYMHELLHNLGLWHAADATACPYCDWTCVMGWCCANRCPNAPHLRMLGWADPVAGGSLALGSLPEGRLTTLRLPLQHAVGGSMAVVDTTAGTGKGLQFFLSYRSTEPPYDDVVGTDGRYSHVQLHQRFVGDVPTPGEGMDTMQLARFARAGLTWQDPATRLAVGIAYVGANDAGVVVCRAAALPGGAPNWSSCDTSLSTLSLLGGRMQSGLPATTTTAAPRPPSPTPPRPGAKNSQRAPNLPPFYLEDPSPKQSPALAAKPPKAGRRNPPPPPPPSPPPPLAAAGKPPRKRRNGAARSATAGPDSGAVPSLRLRTSSRRHLRALLPSS
ncbi:hypothetical protein HYH03_003388 [Edaphochlamys debaryana]|uniref:Peptidase M11 gametolysin domain-containing protein n=1 Tax=Edaphochlamys debaryana TaxID=47281 RepID=A0A836C4D0_9CHLO|nr:hypothetical protein HYH03_003388 [Edaphochlamys debaryana]|eukprot:KAG2498642.1 hypothetical protein HYH03_003388 [Edaphochlamys debaryana]